MSVWLGVETGLVKRFEISNLQALENTTRRTVSKDSWSVQARLSTAVDAAVVVEEADAAAPPEPARAAPKRATQERRNGVTSLCSLSDDSMDVLCGTISGQVYRVEYGMEGSTLVSSPTAAVGPVVGVKTDAAARRAVWWSANDLKVHSIDLEDDSNEEESFSLQSSWNIPETAQVVTTADRFARAASFAFDGSACRGAFGGKDMDLRVWDVNAQKETWKARNVPNTDLDTPVPIWVTDCVWIPGSPSLVATSTAYGQVRLYDTRAGAQRRPVSEFVFPDGHHLNTIVSTGETGRNFVVADSYGTVTALDVSARLPMGKFKGAKGSVRALGYCARTNVLVAGGLDRCVRVYDVTSREMLVEALVKQRINVLCIENRTHLVPEPEVEEPEEEETREGRDEDDDFEAWMNEGAEDDEVNDEDMNEEVTIEVPKAASEKKKKKTSAKKTGEQPAGDSKKRARLA